MDTILNIPYENPRAQCVVMLFAALSELGGSQTKQDVLRCIRERNWFQFIHDDHKPYPSAITNEERWMSLIAWARKDAVQQDQLFSGQRDAWELTRLGKESFLHWRKLFASGHFESRLCFLWTLRFKTYMQPSYIHTDREWPRPLDMYRDIFPPQFRSVRKRVNYRTLDLL